MRTAKQWQAFFLQHCIFKDACSQRSPSELSRLWDVLEAGTFEPAIAKRQDLRRLGQIACVHYRCENVYKAVFVSLKSEEQSALSNLAYTSLLRTAIRTELHERLDECVASSLRDLKSDVARAQAARFAYAALNRYQCSGDLAHPDWVEKGFQTAAAAIEFYFNHPLVGILSNGTPVIVALDIVD